VRFVRVAADGGAPPPGDWTAASLTIRIVE
jgi:hypothetical protein